MSRHLLFAWLLAAGVVSAQPASAPPHAARRDFREVFHGREFIDPYHWLEDFKAPQAKTWIDVQDRHTRSVLASLPGQEYLRARIDALTRVNRDSIPVVRGGRYFYTRIKPDDQQPVLCMRRGTDAAEDVLVDSASLSADRTASAGYLGISRDGKLVAYAVRQSGQDEVEVRVLDVDGRKTLDGGLPRGLYGNAAFAPDGSGFYYTRRSRKAGSRVFFHRIGIDPEGDRELFGKDLDASVFLDARVSDDGRWLLISASYGWARSELYALDRTKPQEPARRLTPNVAEQFREEMCGLRQLILWTTWKAPRRRALLVDLEKPAVENWREIVPESADTLRRIRVIGGKIYAEYLHEVKTQIRTYSLGGARLADVVLPEAAIGSVDGDWDRDEGFVYWQSFTTSRVVYRFNVWKPSERKLWSSSDVPVKPAEFEVKQVWYESRDGTRVPMYLVHKKGLRPGGNLPVYLTGYGGFNVPLLPAFNPTAILWAELGGVWAQPNLRGGAEFGEEWHRAGMLDKKQNVFDDFIAAAEWLIAHKYTNPARLAISGVSNGGLLVGAALSQRPDLFRAVYCGYPDLDMVRYFRYAESNNPPALLEYGDGAKAEHIGFLAAYSPYERVKVGERYPSVLLTTGEGDTRVPPPQAVKMAAKLQWATRSGRPVLLRFDRKSGHAGGRPRSQVIADNAAEQAFLMHEVGITVPRQ